MEMLERIADERGVFVVPVRFVDTNGNAITPSSASWRLTDVEGTVINGRSNVAIASPSTTANIVLKGADLAISEAERPAAVHRRLRVTYTYTGFGQTLTPQPEIGFLVRQQSGV